MNYTAEYENWLANADEETRKELLSIKNDENEIKERFGAKLEFGTAGLRGIMGAGTRRINIYTIRQVTQGLANCIIKSGGEQRGVAIAYDSRHNSPLFALETALVFAANGVKAYLFESLRPTPELSFAIRHLGAISGVVVTSSHNPKQYNGYKVYWEDGGQLPPKVSCKVLEEIDAIGYFETKTMTEEAAIEAGLLEYIGEYVDEAYLNAVLEQNRTIGGDLSIIYTPIHGAGNILVRETLKRAGFTNVQVVKEQELPDGDFPTAPYPNPEVKQPFEMAIEYAKKSNADLILATDPDADRVGAAYLDHDGEYYHLNGNQVGALLTEYVLSRNGDKGGTVISTIVSTRMTSTICKAYGVDYYDVYTGFKFIAEKILELELAGNNNFIMGWEESYGYLAGSYARDKDAVVASMLIAELAQTLKNRDLTMRDALSEMYKKYGYHVEGVLNVVREGLAGVEVISGIMADLRENTPTEVGGFKVKAFRDYKAGTVKHADGSITSINMESANVVYFEFEEGVEMAVRPSGTEPKLKFYFFVTDAEEAKADEKCKRIREAAIDRWEA